MKIMKLNIDNSVGRTMTEGIWFSGVEGEGEYKRWYKNGKLNVHCFFKDGELDGEYKKWHRNGQLRVHKFYKNGKEVK